MVENFDVFTEQSQLIARRAYEIALQHRHSTIDESHMLLALLESTDDVLTKLFEVMSLDIQQLKNETYMVMKRQRKVAFWKGQNYQFFATPTIKGLIEDSVSISKKLGQEKVSSAHVFAGLVNVSLKNHQAENGSNVAQILINSKITARKVLEDLKMIDTKSKDNKKAQKT